MADTVISMKQITGEMEKQAKFAKDIEKAYKSVNVEAGKISAEIGGSSGNRMAGSMGKFSMGEKFAMGAQMIGGVVSAGFGALPSTSDVIQRATGYYNSAVMQGTSNSIVGGGRNGMYKHLRDGLGKFGIQSPQATAQLGQFYGARGVTMGSAYEQNLTSAVGGAARYLNMDTNRAAAALEGLTAGAGGQSMNMLQTLGIFTADPTTGKVKTQKQLFSEIHSRLTAGREKASVSDVQESFRRGNLGNFLKTSGMTEDQQQMYYLSELYRADSGKELDLSNKKEVAAAMKGLEAKGLVNPQQELNAIAASEEGVLEAGTDSYIAGLKTAVPIIESLNKGMEGLAASVGGLKAVLDTIGSTGVGGAASGLVGGLVGGGMNLVGDMLGNRGGKNGAAANAAKGGNAAGAVGKAAGVLGKVAGGLGVVGGVIGIGASTIGAHEAAKANDGWGVAGNMLAAAGTGALAGAALGTIVPGLGNVAGAVIGGSIGLVSSGIGALVGGSGGANEMGRGGNTASSGSANTATKSKDDKPPKFVRPATGNISSPYGPRTRPTAGASTFHRGVDIANGQGTPIVAAADGTVIFAGVQGGFGNHVKISHSGGYTTSYSHMARIKVSKGQRVAAGNQVGTMGSTGVSTGPHLHFEVLKNGNNIDPATVVPGLGGGSVTATVTSSTPAGTPTSASQSSGASNWGASASGAQGVTGGINGANSSSSLLGSSSATSDYLSTPGQVSSIFTPSGTTSEVAADGEGKGGPASVGLGYSAGMADMGTTSSGSGGGRNVVINLTIKQASEGEARRFAKVVKEILEEDDNFNKIGRA